MSTRDIVSRLLTFCEEVSGVELYAYQRFFAYRIIESILLNDGATITALFSRQSGKSYTVRTVVLGLAVLLPILARTFPNDERLQNFKDGILIGVYAPIKELAEPIYLGVRATAESERVQELLAHPEVNVHLVHSRGDSLAFSNGSVIIARTASENTLSEGKTHHLIIIDEAQRVSKNKVDKELVPMLSATHGSMVKIGTAWMSRGGFHHDIQQNIAMEEHGGPRNHFQFDYQQVMVERRRLYDRHRKEYGEWLEHCKNCPVKDTDHSTCKKNGRAIFWRRQPASNTHLLYEKSIQTILAKLNGNTDNEEFKMNYRLLWQENRTIALREDVFRMGALPGSDANVPKHQGRQYAGLDIAKERDSTVLTIKEIDFTNPVADPVARDKDGRPVLYYTKYTLAWLELQGSFEGGQYDAIVAFLRNFNVSLMVADATGIGDPFIERLQVLLPHIEIRPFKFTKVSKSDLFKHYLAEWDAGREKYPAGEQTLHTIEYQHFEQQHLELEREFEGTYLVCQGPEDSHDDYPVSGALATWATREQVIPVVEVEVDQLTRGDSGRRGMIFGSGGETPGRAMRYQSGRRRV